MGGDLLSRLRGDKRRVNSVQHLLTDDEEIVANFSALTHSPLWVTTATTFLSQLGLGFYDLSGWLRALLIAMLLGVIVGYFVINTNYVIVATNKRTIVGRAGPFVASKMQEVESFIPPHVRIGPSKGIFWSKTESLGPKLRYHTYFDGEVRAADARSALGPATQPNGATPSSEKTPR